MFKKVKSPESKKLLGIIIDDIMGEYFDETYFDPAVEEVPLFSLLPRNFQVCILSKVVTSLLLGKPLENTCTNVAAYAALIEHLRGKLEMEADESLIRKGTGFSFGGVCYYPKASPGINPELLARMSPKERRIVNQSLGPGRGVSEPESIKSQNGFMEAFRIIQKYTENDFSNHQQQQRKEIKKSMKKTNHREDSKGKPQFDMSFEGIMTFHNFFLQLKQVFKFPTKDYYLDPNATNEEVLEAFYYRQLVIQCLLGMKSHDDTNSPVSMSFQGVHQSQVKNYEISFWDKICKWILLKNYVNIPNTYEEKNQPSISSDRLLFGEYNRLEDPQRFDFIRIHLMKEVKNFHKSFSSELFCRSYFLMKLYGCDSSMRYYNKSSKIHELVRRLKKQEGEDQKIYTLKDCLDKQMKNRHERVYLLFHSIMIDKKRNYDSLEDQYKTLMEIEDKDIIVLFTSGYKKEKDYGKDSIKEEFGRKVMGHGALPCKTCYVPETIYKLHRKCSVCKSVRYCSVKCQKKHWKIHKKNCVKLKNELKKRDCTKTR